jgi:hypothetical protein
MRRTPTLLNANDTSKISQLRQVGKHKLRTKQKLCGGATTVSADRTFGR